MYLKYLDITGFKSFAQKTRLVFEPGITAVVGPNGCGKSNISDAIRWVLGEQRPTALRGSSMTDVIFNGTELRKPLGMAEVSITFADCEDKLGTEYNEVTVSRRVFRSGEGQYFLNKNPCRLRDIQRLFMGTGIGTTSYSIMAQGQIDAILSSRPEDRRMVFEEASGITRFKADRREALRKLEQTDANLLRLADVIREVKRQIGSLQRQAAKAARFKDFRSELRGLDVYVTARRAGDLEQRIDQLAQQMSRFESETARHDQTTAELEQKNAELRFLLLSDESEIDRALEAAMQAQNRLSNSRDILRINAQRIEEYRVWSQRDEREIVETRAVHEAQEEALTTLGDQLTELEGTTREAEAQLAEAREHHEDIQRVTERLRKQLQDLRGEAVERERSAARAQTELAEVEARERGAMVARERLAAEEAQLRRSLEGLQQAGQTLEDEKETLEDLVANHQTAVEEADAQRTHDLDRLREVQQERATLQSQIAARGAQLQLLEDNEENAGEYPAGTRLLFDPENPLQVADGELLGMLAEQVSAPPEARRALEAALRPWLDAVVVNDVAGAVKILAGLLASGRSAGTRLIAAEGCAPPPAGGSVPTLPRLLDSIELQPAFVAAAERLLAHVYVVESLDDIPQPLPSGCTFVTWQGALVRDDGCIELWMPEGAASNPLARSMLAADAREQLALLELDLQRLDEQGEKLSAQAEAGETVLRESRRLLDEARRVAAQKDGELQSSRRDAKRMTERLETVAWEHKQAAGQAEAGETRKSDLSERLKTLLVERERISETLSSVSGEVQTLEQQLAQSQAELTEHRLRFSSLSQQTEHLRTQHRAGRARLEELGRVVQGRTRGLQSYEESIARLSTESEEVSEQLGSQEEEVARLNGKTEELRQQRAQRQATLDQAEGELRRMREKLDSIRNRRYQTEVQLAEARMLLRNHFERLEKDYNLSADELAREPEPEWTEDEVPALEELDRRIAQLRGQIEAIGPVNLVAIEEFQELEEHHAFLAAQEEDLIKGKEQILDLIKRINVESTKLFRTTFDEANKNFQSMFTQLFNGGRAELVLLDDDDVLECGIDIVARPPGKRLQNISLLSGGERTMTAVALLFAIYMVKPSPFALLDELDASLDDSNIGRFVQALKGFLDMSQFLIITHNQYTIAGADIVYGVTMPEKGVSRIVSMRLKQVGVEELDDDGPALQTEYDEGEIAPHRRRRRSRSEPAAEAGDESGESTDAADGPASSV